MAETLPITAEKPAAGLAGASSLAPTPYGPVSPAPSRPDATVRLSDAELRVIMERMPALAWSVDASLRFTSSLGAGLRGLNLQPNDVLGMSLYEYFGTDDPNMLPIAAHLNALKGETANYEFEWQDRWFHTHVEPMRLADGRIAGAIGVALDVTDRKNAERELQDSRRTFQLLAENVPGVIYLCRNDARYTMLYLNDAVEALTGYSKADFLEDRVSFTELFHPEDAPRIASLVDQQLALRRPFHLIYRIQHKSGQWRWVEESGAGVFGPKGELLYLEGFLSDITLRRTAELALRESEDRYRRLVEACPDAILIYKQDKVAFINRTGLELLGVAEPEEIVGRDPLELVHPEHRDVFREQLSQAAQKGRRTPLIELKLLRRDGSSTDVEASAGPFIDRGEPAVQFFFRGIADRKQALEALKESESRFRRLFESNMLGMLFWDVSGRVTEANDTFLQMVGYSREDLRAGRVHWKAMTPAEYGHLDQLALREIVEQGTCTPFEKEYVRKDGTRVQILLGAAFLEGSREAGIGFVIDISARKRAEEQLQRQLEVERRRAVNLRQLDAVATEIAARTELGPILETVVHGLVREFALSRVEIWLTDDERSLISLRAEAGSERHTRLAAVPLGFGPVGSAVQDNQTRVEQHGDRFGRPVVLGETPFRTLVAAPLKLGAAALGALCIESPAGRGFDSAEVAMFELFADHLAAAIQRCRMFDEVRSSRRQLETMSRRLVEIQEAERRNLARELHDEIGQTLTGLKLLLESIDRPAAASSPESSAPLEQARGLVNDLMAQVRALSLQLRPGMLDDLGLLPALIYLFQRYEQQTGIRVLFGHYGLEQRFDAALETAAYRIMQEALTNVARHAQADEVSVHVWNDGSRLTLQIEDRGRGFDPSVLSASADRAGLAGMRERARLIGGRLLVDSQPGAGTRITAELPLTLAIPDAP